MATTKADKAAITRAHARSEADLKYTIAQRKLTGGGQWDMPSRYGNRRKSSTSYMPQGSKQLTQAEHIAHQALLADMVKKQNAALADDDEAIVEENDTQPPEGSSSKTT